MMSIGKFIDMYNRMQGGYFFSHKNLEFFGESAATMHVEPDLKEHTTETGDTCKCYTLVSVQHIPILNPAYIGYCHKRQPHAFIKRICRTYFDVETMRDVGREYEDVA